jgi:hypothetical protein
MGERGKAACLITKSQGPKSQVKPNGQDPNPTNRLVTRAFILEFGHWDLGLHWDLGPWDLGPWDLGPWDLGFLAMAA